MFKNIRFYAAILLCWGLAYSAHAQEETSCDPTANLPVAQGEVLFNYGSVTNSFSFTNRSDMTVGQPLVGRAIGRDNISEYGFWTRFLLPPQPPTLQATQGDFPDRVQLMWNIDPLSAAATEGYIIKRDGAFLADVDGETNQFIDFNVQAGEFYEYTVIGRNQFGNGSAGTDVGFVNPNGVVTGKIETFSGNPVADAIVTLEPTIGKSMAFDGVKDYLCISHQAAVPTDMWTLSTWVKIGDNSDNAGIIDFGSDINKNYWLKTTASGSPKGIVAGVGDGTAPHELTVEFAEDADGWHHVAMVYSAGMLIVYVDGVYEGSMRAAIVNEDALFNIGANRSQTNFFHGKLDDIRLYDKPLTQTDIILTKDITVSSTTPNLVAYWKMDEGLGRKAFDIAGNDMDAFIQGANFDSDTPDILNAGMTDVGGYYIIEGVNYSEEQTFQARPRKSFYNHYSIEYNAAFEACTNLTSFDLSDTATVEITVQPFDLVSRQTILSQGTNFELYIENSAFHLMINGTDQELGPASAEFQHLALLLNGMNGQVQYYRNGSLVNTLSGYSLTGDFSTSPWQLAAKGGTMPTGFFTGLIDDVAFFDTLVSVPKLQIHASPIAGEGVESGVDAGDGNLIAYFPLDAGSGTEVVDYGPLMTGTGEVKNASFSIIAYRQVESPHEFRPSERVVNLNPSITAVGNIDFVDESTVTISGVVRFSETFCYQDSVQLYVNGFPSFPPIFTDQDGRFVGDFEPGSNITLTPVFADTTHKFTPPFFETRKLNRPIAGVLFQNTTKRDIYGQIAGGDCRLSINFPEAPVRVKAATLNGCYEQELAITALDGKYHFEDLPPLPMAVSITYHPDNTIYQDFQVQGGQETDLRMMEDDTIDFIYIAPPQVELESFEPFAACPGGDAFIEQSTPQNGYRLYKNDVRVYEEYKNERCYLDTFNLRINNAVADAPEYRVTVSDTTTFPLEYWAGLPNLGGDYKKLLQVTAETSTGTATATEEVVVLGERSRETTFTTASPAMPLIVLRDPPGDGSNATLSAGTTNCSTWSNTQMISRTEERSLNIDLGTKVVTYAGTPFGGIIMENEDQAELDFTASATAKVSTESSMEVCVTNDIEYSTTDDDAIIGEDADLYVGAAVNFEFSTTDVLGYDFENCEFTFDQNFRVWPEGFGTKYIYSEWQIETDVIPSLLLIGDTTSAQAWQRIIDENHRAKANAVLRENVTFDGLVSIAETQETSTTSASSFEFDLTVSAEMASTLGFEVFDVGTKVTVKSSIEGGVTASEATSTSETTTVSYTLADDDPNDNFTIDILDDGVYGTPVFKVRSGESMCPWEEGTLNREEVGFASDALTAVNVPENASAVFNLQMTNLGQTGNDPLIYILGLVEGSNPDGAALIVDGEPLTDPRVYQILPNETLDILLAVERGPLAYSYDSLGIFMASECMWEHSRGLGYDLANTMGGIDPETGEAVREGPYKSDDLAKFYEELRLNVEFIEPCTPIDISFPMQDWVVTPTDNDRLLITLNDYIYNDPDLDIVRVQYRRTGGDGSWINIVELPASEFANDPVFKIVEWDMTELKDGPYEIRAVSQCTDVSLNPGISTIVKGRKETQAPELFGTPQPADGVLNPGDEISITFTKRIQCDQIFQADGIGANINFNNLALVDVATGALIDAIITCQDDKIIVVPNIQNQYIENRTLRVVTNGIKDFYGNETDEIAWEFFVNRSNLYWDGGGIDEMVQKGNRLIVTKEIRNQGGEITSFDIPSIPDWMQVFPRSGSLAPGTRQTVTFEFPADLLVDTYETTVIMETVDGDEPLDVKLRVNCEGPDWNFDATQYSFSMNLTVELDIEGVISTDEVDRIAAFVGTELRGLAYVEYAEELDRYLAFLTVYSNAASGETVDFQIWDADVCTLYGNTLENFPFEPDGLIGEPLAPQTIHTSGLILKKIYINPGWNWISYNIELQDPNINEALASLTNPSTGLIKDQTTFANYSDNLGIWGGSLTELTHLTMYQYRSSAYDSLLLVGMPVDPTTPMPITTGWNWIGYLPQQGMAVDEALSSLTPLNGDIVKGQFTFAQYVAGIGWIGNLNFMTSPKGYQLRISNPGTLVYPAAGSGNLVGGSLQAALKNRQLEDEPVFSHWEVNPQAYEYTMNFIGLVRAGDNSNFLAEGDEVAAFVEDEVRGSSQVIYIPELDAHLIFLTVYANREGERLTFKFFDASAGEEMALQEESSFLINAIQGTVDEPVEWSFLTTDIAELNADGMHFRAFPNPAREVVYLRFDAELDEEVTIVVTDALGREVQRLDTKALARENTLEWRPKVPSGLYFVTLHRATSIQTLRLEIKQ